MCASALSTPPTALDRLVDAERRHAERLAEAEEQARRLVAAARAEVEARQARRRAEAEEQAREIARLRDEALRRATAEIEARSVAEVSVYDEVDEATLAALVRSLVDRALVPS